MVLLFFSGLAALLAHVSAIPYHSNTPATTSRTGGSFHIPLQNSFARESLDRRSTGKVGLGDDVDVTYNVMVEVGSIKTPVVLDTGSADLWILSDACGSCSSATLPLYPTSSLHDSGLTVQLLYGDSSTGTHADGPIGKDTAGIAGLTLDDQYFAAISDTNTSVLETGSAGIFGLGFPINSVIFNTLLSQPSSGRRQSSRSQSTGSAFSSVFPDLSFIQSSSGLVSGRSSSVTPEQVLAAFYTSGPLVPRLALNGVLSSPVITITLQRDTMDIGGNAGMLSLGDLPPTVDANNLTWVPLRGYSPSEGGLPAPADSPNEVYPLTWEVFIDNVYFDGQRLPQSNLSSSNISLSALIDTGNSLTRGPQDVLSIIFSILGSSSSSTTSSSSPKYPCSEAHTLTFEIGGTMFPVDPRDLGAQTSSDDDGILCTLNLAVTDPPSSGGFLYSWSLGDPFLKSALVSFYYGNLTYPSKDQPRVGFLSTVPSDANDQLQSIVAYASASLAGMLPETSEIAPTGTPAVGGTNSAGVQQAAASGTALAGEPSRSGSGSGSSSNSGAGASVRLSPWSATGLQSTTGTLGVFWELGVWGGGLWAAVWVWSEFVAL